MPDFRFIKASICFFGDESPAIFRSSLSVKKRCSLSGKFKISSLISGDSLRRFIICVTRARLMRCRRASSALLTVPASNCFWNCFAIWRGWGLWGFFFLTSEEGFVFKDLDLYWNESERFLQLSKRASQKITGQDFLAFSLSWNFGPTSSRASPQADTISVPLTTYLDASDSIMTPNTGAPKRQNAFRDPGI